MFERNVLRTGSASRRFFFDSVTFIAFGWLIFGCSKSAQLERPGTVSLWGHSMGENAMAWAAEEPNQRSDPLSACQELLRSAYAEQSLERVEKCRVFVDHGSYLVNLTGAGGVQKVFRFTSWRLSMMAVRFPNGERNHVLAELDSRFVNNIPGKFWHSPTDKGILIELPSAEEVEPIIGTGSGRDGFWIVVTQAD